MPREVQHRPAQVKHLRRFPNKYWVKCTYCARWGKIDPELHDSRRGIEEIRQIDMVGNLCVPCIYRKAPPHYDYLCKMLPCKIAGMQDVVRRIASSAYKVCWEADRSHVLCQYMLERANEPLLPEVLKESE